MKKSCQICIFALTASGLARPVLICCNKYNYNGEWFIVGSDERCQNFKLNKNILPPNLDSPEHENTKFIPLTKGKFALVDAEDYDRLNKFKWYAIKGLATYYAARAGRKSEGLSRSQIYMHRVVINIPPNMAVDHIDHNGLNNTKANLRICTQSQNTCNRRVSAGKTSKYKGVSRKKHDKKWAAKIAANGTMYHLGYFKSEIDAARAYDQAAKKYHKDFACLNFPD